MFTSLFSTTLNARELVFPLVIGDSKFTAEGWSGRANYLGTGFFIGESGIALTAAHVMPQIEPDSGKTVFAGVLENKRFWLRPVVACEKAGGDIDIAAIRVARMNNPYWKVSLTERHMGENVWASGIPAESADPLDGSIRMFKGHIMRGGRYYELNFPAVRGMSGSPVGSELEIIGVVSDNHRSEILEDQHSEEVEVTPGFRRTLEVKTVQVINFGRVEPLYRLGKAGLQALIDKVIAGS
jgi:hypothetical protein